MSKDNEIEEIFKRRFSAECHIAGFRWVLTESYVNITESKYELIFGKNKSTNDEIRQKGFIMNGYGKIWEDAYFFFIKNVTNEQH